MNRLSDDRFRAEDNSWRKTLFRLKVDGCLRSFEVFDLVGKVVNA